MKRILILCCIFVFAAGCASVKAKGNKDPISFQEVNLEAVLEENSGLEITIDDVNDVRDYYRAGVQQKGKAEKAFLKDSLPEALAFYRDSNQCLSKLMKYIDADSARFNLFDDSDILFFPNLLMADNHLKMGKILKKMQMNWQARQHWRRGLSLAKDSMEEEPTVWGLAVQQELKSLLAGKSG
jgi:hypothetical protein